MKIDAVITWVDGSDPVLASKQRQYGAAAAPSEAAGKERYLNRGEIRWCVRSINKFAPWFNHIYIVTDGQDPGVTSEIPLTVVDHREVFGSVGGQYLPCFNSLGIESMLWNIPGLAEHYVYFNDDCCLVSPVSEADFFTADGSPVCYARPAFAPWIRVLRNLRPQHGRGRQVTIKHTMLETVELARSLGVSCGVRSLWFPFVDHTPKALRVSVFAQMFETRPALLARNLTPRFRDFEQFRADVLAYMIMLRDGTCVRRPFKPVLFYFMAKHGLAYFDRKFSVFADPRRSCTIKFACFNGFERADSSVYDAVSRWIERRLA